MNQMHPILYSFRRCPYAMRARMAIAQSSLSVELREVVLRNKPQQLLDISAKATVPVLQLENGEVIDESLKIMQWALSQQDPGNWLNKETAEDSTILIAWNDNQFKYYLDHYKYADRYPEYSAIYYREKAEYFISELEKRLHQHPYLCGKNCSLADIAIFPFIRQFAHVDLPWFQSSTYQKSNLWLNTHIESDLFESIMEKYPAWDKNDAPLIFSRQEGVIV